MSILIRTKIFILKAINIILSMFHIQSFIRKQFNDLYHNYIYSLLLSDFNKAYKMVKSRLLRCNDTSNIIWIFWWQGIHHAPIIVKRCIQSIRHYSNGHKVIVLNRYNLKQYVHLPKYIYYKVNKGKITLTHFSDIIRFNLLDNYGGLWIDSTMYCTSNLDSSYFNSIYTSGGYINKNDQFVSSKWTGFLIGGYKHSLIFQFMDTFYKIYWKYNNDLIDYFLTDYALQFSYKNNISNFRTYVDKVAYKNNPHLYDLVNNLNNRFSTKKYRKMTSDTNLFKLTYKNKFDDKYNTFFNRLLGNKL